MATLIDELPFEIAARVPIQLGRESISSSTVAISELIKNSYDANAKSVTLSFEGNREASSISISDVDEAGESSIGMSLTDLKEYWLTIGTDHKYKSELKSGRVQTGAKGLGRLGLDRLCSNLSLYTKTASERVVYKLVLDWGRYESERANLSEIKHKLYSYDIDDKDLPEVFRKPSSGGTYMHLEGLKDHWSEGDITELCEELSLLVSPFRTVIDFGVYVKNLNDSSAKKVEPSPMLHGASWSMNAYISSDNKVSVSVSDIKNSKLYEENSVPWSEWIKERGEAPECGPVSFELYYVPWDAPGFKELDFSKRDWRDFMDSNQGVRIYRDYFRVRPYGEPSGKGDWLDLGLRRSRSPGGISQDGWRVGPHQVVGAVFISRNENSNLQDQTNREGIVESKAFFDLRAFSVRAIEYFENRVVESAKANKKNSAKSIDSAKDKYVKEKEEFDKRFEEVFKNSEVDKGEVERLVEGFHATSLELQAAIEVEAKNLEEEKNTLANLASLGILTVSFGHEAREYSNLAKADSLRIKKEYQKGKIIINDLFDDYFSQALDSLVDSTTFINNFAAFALSNVAPDKRRRKKVSLVSVFKKVFKVLDTSLVRQNVSYEILYDQGYEGAVRAFQIDIESIIVNLITNSVWAMRHVPESERVIEVKIGDSGGQVVVEFSDSGCGLEFGTEQDIFKPMFSTRRNRKGIVEGTGMGLAITKTFVVNHCQGSITASNSSRLGGALFEICFPSI